MIHHLVQGIEGQLMGGGGGIPDLPTDMLVGHYMSDQGITLTGSGTTATVNEWKNQISDSHHLTQQLGVAYEPTYVPESPVFGGRPMLLGVNDALNPATTADDFTLTEPGVFTYAFVYCASPVGVPAGERYIYDQRGRGSGQPSGTAGYTENGIEATSGMSWHTVGQVWNNAGYGGPLQGHKPYASGTNLNLAPQSYNNASYPNLFASGLQIWIYVQNGGYSYWSCNGTIMGSSTIVPSAAGTTQFDVMENWDKADKISPSIFSGYYGPNRGYGTGAMAELLVYDKAITTQEHNDLLDNLSNKYSINYYHRTTLEDGDVIIPDFEDFKVGTTAQINIQGQGDVLLNTGSCLLYTSPSPRD